MGAQPLPNRTVLEFPQIVKEFQCGISTDLSCSRSEPLNPGQPIGESRTRGQVVIICIYYVFLINAEISLGAAPSTKEWAELALQLLNPLLNGALMSAWEVPVGEIS
jgi:hypothetical protein